MPTPKDVVVFVGSLRKASFTRKVALALAELAPESMKLDVVEIGNLPLYNQDLETENPPLEWTAFRERVQRADAVLFATPEYNRSVPGVLKNAIDVASRPFGRNAWDRKPAAVVSVSPGALAGFGANHHLRQSLVFLNVPVMQQPEAYIGNAAKLVDDAGQITVPATRDFLVKVMTEFDRWIDLVSPNR